MKKAFIHGLDKAVGFALPIQRWQAAQAAPRWMSEVWNVRRGKLVAVPGDSSLGYRLPLGTLPYVPPSSYPYIHPRDTSEPREPLPDFGQQAPKRARPIRASAWCRSRPPLVPTGRSVSSNSCPIPISSTARCARPSRSNLARII